MSRYAKLVAWVPMALLVLSLGSCDRNITVVEEIVEPQSCFGCHDDQNTFLIAAELQWENSFHASGLNIDRGGSATCAACHISEGFVQRSKGEEVTSNTNPTVIHCFTCHEPHTAGNFGLRWNEPATLQNGESFDLSAGNLCVACHQARRNVDTYVAGEGDRVRISSTHWGPHHSNQGDMLLGSNGYEYSGYDYESTNHRGATDDGCLDCHFKATENNVIGGHSFNVRGILRDEGGEGEELLNVAACEPCHGEIDDFNVDGVQDEVHALVDELDELLEASGLWHDGHPVAMPSGTTTSADSAGAVWNLLMVEEGRSFGVHNAKYTIGLLESAIMFMKGELSPSGPRADLVGN